MSLQVHQFACLDDNYGFLIHDPDSAETVAIDTPDAAAYLAQARALGWTITQVWNTHWHPDHAGGNAAIKAATGCTITAPAAEASRIDTFDRLVGQGDTVAIGANNGVVIDVGGHTLGHIAYHLPAGALAFTGDALFALGCGRMFEGTAPQFWESLSRLKALPPETMIYCAHEYTASNARFAKHVDPDNSALQAYLREIAEKRAAGEATVPFRLDRELATNPFLRVDDVAIQSRIGAGDTVATFAKLREMKDTF